MADNYIPSNFEPRFNSFVGKTGIIVGVLLMPPVFSLLFTVGPFIYNESKYLWIISILSIGASLIFILRRHKINSGKSLIYFACLVLVFIEIIFRLYVNLFAQQQKSALEEQSNFTYAADAAYVGHPFLQFIGKHKTALKGNEALGKLPPFNNFGFVGKDFKYEKDSNIIRVACLGESTTADGYPAILETYLNNHRTDSSMHYEVLNFGHAFWTTNHSVVNFALNVLDFHPDYIVIHHGWNEEKVRDAEPGEFRGDYFHDLKVFSPSKIYDRYLIRVSAFYRFVKFKFDQSPEWTTLVGVIEKKRERKQPQFQNLAELKPFERNLTSIINLALVNNIHVILTTLPHSTDPNIGLGWARVSIDQCNTVSRSIAHQFENKIQFADLDSMITGKHNEVFKDLGHVNDDGRKMKAEVIGELIHKSLPSFVQGNK